MSLLVGIEAAQRLDDHQGRAALYGPLFTCQLERAFDASGTARCWAFEVAGDRAVGLFTVHIGNSLEFTGRLVVFDLASGAPLWTLEHPDPLLRLDLHPSGKVAVLGTQGGEVLGVDLEGQRELFRSRVGAEGVPVHAVEFAEDARTLVALTAEHLVRLAFPSGETLRTLPTPSEALAHVAHAPGDDHLLVAPRAMQGVVAESASAWILRRDPAAWRELPGEHAVRWAEWAPDHERVVIGDAAGGARVLGLDGELLAELTASDALNVVRFSPDGTRLALGTEAGEVLVHDLGRGAEVARFRQDRAVVRLAWSPTGDRVASAGLDATMRVYALDRPRQLALGRGEMRPVGLSWDEAGERVLTWNLGARVYAWCAGPMPYAYRLDDTRDVQAAGFDADGAWTLASGTLRRFELEREGDHHRLVRTHRVLHTGAEQVAVGDGRAVWVADGALQVSGPDGVQQRGDAMAGVLEVSLAPGGAAAAVLTPEGLHLVDALDGRVRWTRGGRYDRVVFSPDGLRLFACAVEGPAELLGAADGALVRQLDLCARDLVFGPGGELAIVERGEQERLGRLHVVAEDGSTTAGPVDFRHRRIAWSPRGDVLLGGGPGPELALYRREGARLEVERPRIRPEGNVTSIALHPSGNWFAAATEARRAGHTPPEVLVWEVGKDDAPLFTSFPLHAGTVTVVRFGPQADDPRVLSAGVDGAFVWPLDPLPAAPARIRRDIDHHAWARERLLAIGTKE